MKRILEKYGMWSLSKNSVFVILRSKRLFAEIRLGLDLGIQKVLKTLDSRLSSFVVATLRITLRSTRLRRTGRENDNFIWGW